MLVRRETDDVFFFLLQEVSSYRIQSTILDQTKVVNNGQNLIVWINRAMSITLKISKMAVQTFQSSRENISNFRSSQTEHLAWPTGQ